MARVPARMPWRRLQFLIGSAIVSGAAVLFAAGCWFRLRRRRKPGCGKDDSAAIRPDCPPPIEPLLRKEERTADQLFISSGDEACEEVLSRAELARRQQRSFS
jgi:hypothetical protein